MKKIVVAIHGLGKQPSPSILKAWWKYAMKDGLRRRPISLVYWADIVHQGESGNWQKIKQLLKYRFSRHKIDSKLEGFKGFPLKRRLFRYLDANLDDIFLTKDMDVRFKSLTDKVVRHFFIDLDAYYSVDQTTLQQNGESAKEMIQSRLYRVLKKYQNREILLVAHSMGSIIALDVLNRFESELSIHTLVSIGSPLGLPLVKSRIFQDQKSQDPKITMPHTPHNISVQWLNLTDPDDEVALDQSLSDDYGENKKGIGVRDVSIRSDYVLEGKRYPHGAFGYLRSPQMSHILKGFFLNE
ncbi:MAG: hypothetical protein RQ801_00985 [Spirochaetaceae bacterium]|nr:hypothetical protein [Spirochaetaceae bacterium]MDT8296845.1 hypothetical protein [Spirochaetaceae bacterium]